MPILGLFVRAGVSFNGAFSVSESLSNTEAELKKALLINKACAYFQVQSAT